MIVSFKDFELEPRYDGTPWTSIRINESAAETGPWVMIDSQALSFDITVNNPADPQPISFTTDNAVLQPGASWYKIQLVDSGQNIREYDPIFNPATTEVLATLDDVNAHLDGEVIEATADNSNLVQISVARIVRGYLAAIVDTPTLMSWDTPEHTPDIVREIASMLIAAQVYFSLAARQSISSADDTFAQRLYDRAMLMLQGIIDGTIPLAGGGEVVTGPGMSDSDYFPIDATDRAFTMGMVL
jgi:hypothetical protein